MIRAIFRFCKRINYKYFKPWFFSSDDPSKIKIPYVISFVFLVGTAVAFCIHLFFKLWQLKEIMILWEHGGVGMLEDIEKISKVDLSMLPLISLLIGTSGMFIGLYNWGKKKRTPSTDSAGSDTSKSDQDDASMNPAGDGAINKNEI